MSPTTPTTNTTTTSNKNLESSKVKRRTSARRTGGAKQSTSVENPIDALSINDSEHLDLSSEEELFEDMDVAMEESSVPASNEEDDIATLKNKLANLRSKMASLSIQCDVTGASASTSSTDDLIQELKATKSLYCTLSEVYKLLVSEANTQAGVHTVETNSISSDHVSKHLAIVPNNLPFFQWKGLTFTSSDIIYPSPKSCLNQFENVLNSYQLDIETNWRRLVPAQMSPSMNDWFGNLVTDKPKCTWDEFKSALNEKYGISPAVLKSRATTQLFALSMRLNETADQFIHRFNVLRERASITDVETLRHIFTRALKPDALFREVNRHMTMSDDPNKHSIEYMLQKTRTAFDLVQQDSRFVPEKRRQQAKQAQRHKHSSAPRGHPYPAKHQSSTDNAKAKTCRNHPMATSHYTSECKNGPRGNAMNKRNTSHKGQQQATRVFKGSSYNPPTNNKFKSDAYKSKYSPQNIVPTPRDTNNGHDASDDNMSVNSSTMGDEDLQFGAIDMEMDLQDINQTNYYMFLLL